MKQRSSLIKVLAALVLAAQAGTQAVAQDLLPSPGFETGSNQPAGWQPVGATAWQVLAPPYRRVVEASGNGDDASHWQTQPLPLAPGGLYAVHFSARREDGASGGTAVSGTDRINRDFPLTGEWQEYGFCFRQPDATPGAFARLGQWHVKGGLRFDDASLVPVLSAHARTADGIELGEGESIRDGVYRFQPQFGWQGANAHRPLLRHEGQFNSDRFVFTKGSSVVYRFAVPGSTQTMARIQVNLNHYESGTLAIEAGKDGARWLPVGSLNGERRSGSFDLPTSLLPAEALLVRLIMPDNGAVQVNRCNFEARLSPAPADAEGDTRFLELQERSPELGATLDRLRLDESRASWETGLTLSNRTEAALSLRGSLSSNLRTPIQVDRLELAPHAVKTFTLRCPTAQPGPVRLFALIRDSQRRILFSGAASANLAWTSDSRAGYGLSRTGGLSLWWAEAGWKIGRERALPKPAPRGTTPAVAVSAARGEFEAFQLVLRPATNSQLTRVTVQGLKDAGGTPSPVQVKFDEVAYVRITDPTDETCSRGWYPDPLPPLQLPLELAAARNQPLWITVRIPPGTAAGQHTGEILVETSVATNTVPFRVQVYDFDLPADTHLRSALGLGAQAIAQHHRLQRREDQEAVFAKYLENFADHRISPYSFYDFAPIDVQFPEANGQRRAVLDFTRFDQAASRWLDTARFNTFQLPLVGMGGGTFHSRHLGELAGFKEGTPEHTRLFNGYLGQVETHLRERGWLSKAFTYWFDEPDPKDYAFVIEGQKRLKTAAPAIRRMLTEQPEPGLVGNVDIWCALTPEWTPEKVKARSDVGEEVWWYICTAPKAPYVTEFIDHPGTELRLWPWQSWQYGVSGILIWATIYWHSPAAYPDSLQDPWQDPMSWVSGYGYQPGQRSPWGNGDGRFLYPPRNRNTTPAAPALDGPVNSIRWENLRDGMEDYEYLWLLQERIRRADKAGKPADLLQQARALLAVPKNMSQDLTHFTTDPRPILEHRERLAAMIVQLGDH